MHASDRQECIARSRRAIDEFDLRGFPTTLPFHRGMLDMDRFVDGTHTTNYIDDLDEEQLVDFVERFGRTDSAGESEPERTLSVTVGGKQFDVSLAGDAVDEGVRQPGGELTSGRSASNTSTTDQTVTEQSSTTGSDASSSVDVGEDGVVVTDMDGTIIDVVVDVGDTVASGD